MTAGSGPSSWRLLVVKLTAALRHPRSSRNRKTYRERTVERLWIEGSPGPGRSAAEALELRSPHGRGAQPADEALLYRRYIENAAGRHPASDFVPFAAAADGEPAHDVTLIAYYLPQFHPIPENDLWWGAGFTEWRNVARAYPVFDGHYQPRVPGELGYYDLRVPDVMRRQVELARAYGISAFCFYFYWFKGVRLLEAPTLAFLGDPALDIGFSLCWANENWSRRWDGGTNEVLIGQEHSPEDDLEFIRYVERYFRDRRYLRVDGRPVLTVYHPKIIPNVEATLARWRAEAVRLGYPGLYLVATTAFAFTDYARLGFDALSEFPPHHMWTPPLDGTLALTALRTGGAVFSYAATVEADLAKRRVAGTVHPGVMPGWDNTARKPRDGDIFHGATPALFGRWLDAAIERARSHGAGERFVFINAWNEWAEGAYLEPDARFGYGWLQAVRDARRRSGGVVRSGILLVSHDALHYGAQLIALNIAGTLRGLGFDVHVALLGEGPLRPRFEAVATVHPIDVAAETPAAIAARLGALRRGGAELAIVNTAVSGALLPALKAEGFATLALIHELPGVLKSYALEQQARAIADDADLAVFPADMVRDGFVGFVGHAPRRTAIRPQGLYRPPADRHADRAADRARLRRALGLPDTAEIILCAGSVDLRKGLDLLVDACLALFQRRPDAVAVWPGPQDRPAAEAQRARIEAAGLGHRLILPGLAEDMGPFYAGADLFALPSREDPFPSVVLEALDAGLPVVAFDGAGGFDALLRRDCGVLVPPFDAAAMADAIEALLREPARAERLGRNGRAIVEAEFGFPAYVGDLLQLAGRAPPTVSVIVPSYNYARYIAARLRSIFDQSVRPYELIVLDDASTDDSVAIAEATLALSPIPSRLVVGDVNSGSVFRQWQRGLALATGDLVWIAEADDLAEPGFLAELVPAFGDPRIVIGYCQSRQIDGDGATLAEDYLGYVADLGRQRWTRPYVAEGADEIAGAMHVKNTIPNVSAVLFRRQPLQELFGRHGDTIASWRHVGDWVTYLHLLEGGRVAFSPRALNSHRRHGGSLTVANFNLALLTEIVAVQRATARRHGLDAAAADRYAQTLYEQFGLATADHPHFAAHPALRDVGLEAPAEVEDEGWPPAVRSLCAAAAAPLGVSPSVHRRDFLFRFIFDHPGFGSKADAVRYYFEDGALSARQLRAAVDAWAQPAGSPLEFLEFKAGHGAVTRHLKQAMEPHRVSSTDVDPDAARFNAQEFGVETFASPAAAEDVRWPQPYDVVFALSFFSHVPRATWGAWLRALCDGVVPGGLLIFTTHGLASVRHFPQATLDETGYWFERSGEQVDTEPGTYGQAITSKPFVEAELAAVTDVKLLAYEHAAWWGHQDLYVVRRLA